MASPELLSELDELDEVDEEEVEEVVLVLWTAALTTGATVVSAAEVVGSAASATGAGAVVVSAVWVVCSAAFTAGAVVVSAGWVVCSTALTTEVVSTAGRLSVDEVGRRAMIGADSDVDVSATADERVEDWTCSTAGACDVTTAAEDGVNVGSTEV